MILEKQTESNVLTEGQAQESIGMSLDLDSAQILMQMLSKNLYSDDIGSAIRECASNALDSHRRAGVSEPIVVSFKSSSANNYEFCVEDFGIGLDADDVKNIISKYGKSTKRNSNTELGMMGLGFKAPLAYSSSFYFVCRKDGMERKYMMYEGEDVNTIDLLHETSTVERNGVKIIVPVKYNDQYTFRKKIKEQLCYFESVYFDVPSDSSINNEFLISRHPHFQFSEMSTDSKMHICLDNVYYPLDFSKLGIDTIDFPIALRFSLMDGLYPTPNRESLRYTQEAKEIIKNRLSDVANYFVSKYNESIDEGSDIVAMIHYLENSGLYVNFNESRYDIEDLQKFSTVPVKTPSLNGINLLDFSVLYKHNKSNLLQSFELKHSLRYKRMTDCSKNYNYNWTIKHIILQNQQVYTYTDRLHGIKKDYLRHTCNQQDQVFIAKNSKEMQLGHPAKFDNTTYYHLLGLKHFPKNKWREVIKEYQSILDMISSKFINLDDLVIPQTFIDSRKKVKVSSSGVITDRRQPKLKGEIIGKRSEDLQKWSDGRNCKFVPITYKMEDLDQAKHLKVYTSHEDSLTLDALYGIVTKQKIELVTFSQRELNVIKDSEIHNLISIEEFMKGETAPFKRMATAYFIKKMTSKYSYVFEKRDQIGFTSADIKKKLCNLQEYVSDNYAIPSYSGGSSQAIEFLDSMLVIAEDNNLFDMNIYPEALEMIKILEKLSFLNPFCKGVTWYNESNDLVSVLTDLFKYYRYRVDLKHYNIRLNEEVLTEETVEQLID
jgi:hypothetical protein